MDEEILDTSWMETILQETQSETCPPAEIMKSISIYVVYINGKNETVRVTKEKHDLEECEGGSILSEGAVLEIIQRNRGLDDINTRYAFDCMQTFVVSMEPQFLSDFIKHSGEHTDTKIVRIPQKIVFPPSVFLFHNTNCVWMFFREMERVMQTVSILKRDMPAKKRVTKKVRISDVLPLRDVSLNKTRRQ